MLRSFIFVLAAGSSSQLWAQAEDANVSVDDKKIEKVEVTGSHIKRIAVEGASPVVTIQRKDIEKTGYNSVSDVLRDTTMNSFGSARENSGSNAAGNAEVNLRGLGSSKTLVLLNGQRLPSDAVTGAVDLNLVPMAAVERIEVLKDGASATYGSDALGGVVNIITRKDFSGNQVSVSQTLPEQLGGQKREVSLVNGISGEKFSTVNVIQYRDNHAVNSRDREWTNNGISTLGSPGSYRNPGGTWRADANCPAAQVINTPGGSFCGFKYSDYSTELPALQQIGVLSETNYEVDSQLKLVARLGGTQKKVKWSFAPAPDTFTIPGAVADTLGPGGTPLPGATPGQDLQYRYRLADLGTRDTEIETISYNLLLGGTYQVTDIWQVDANASHNIVHGVDKGVNGYALTKDIQATIASGKFNPAGSSGQRGSLENTRYVPVEQTKSELSSLEIKGNGEDLELPGGRIGVAIGGSLTHQKYEDNFDEKSVNGEVFGNAGSSGGGQRVVRALYSELALPITKTIELQLAARFDSYSDFGDSTNPKIAMLWHLRPDLLLRASAGTGFRAPLMQDLYAATSQGFPSFVDHVSCQRERAAGGEAPSCLPQQYEVTSSGNKDLKEERSISYNIGIVYEPNSDFNIGGDLFLTQLKNVVGIDFNDAMLAEKQGINLAKQGVVVKRDSGGYLESITAPLQNLSAQEISGLDLSTMYRFRKIRLNIDHSQLFYFKEEGFPGVGMTDKLGDNGKPAWRNATGLAYIPDDHQEISLVALTTGEQHKIVKSSTKLGQYTTVDARYGYKTKGFGDLSVMVKNIAASTPPLDDTDPNNKLNKEIYDQIGRQLIVGYKLDF